MEKPAQYSPKGRRIGIDFGRNVTVIAASHGSGDPVNLLAFSGISRNFCGPGGCPQVPVIPSVIHYPADGSYSIGEEALHQALAGTPGTLRHLTYYICENNPALVLAGTGRKIGYPEAGARFLTELMNRVIGGIDMATAQVTFTCPLCAPPKYYEWITGVAESAGMRAVSTLDLGCAVARGYGLSFVDGELYVLIDASPDSLEVVVVIPEQEAGLDYAPHSRVLGRASADLGGLTSDSWIASDLLSGRGRFLSDDQRGRVFVQLVDRCRRTRESLMEGNKFPVKIGDIMAGCEEVVNLTPGDIARIFRDNGLFTILDRTISRAFSAARVYGYNREGITAVLMIGELSMIPALQEAVCSEFSPAPVRFDHALDAAARGAVRADASPKPPVRADYALRYWDPVSHEHRYRFLVRRGACYPSVGQVARILISAAYDGQTHLGIPLCRIAGETGSGLGAGLELVATPCGGLRFAGPVTDYGDSCQPVLVNVAEPTYLSSFPPAQKGVPRFELTFTIDEQGYLCFTARDIVTGIVVKNSVRLHRLI